MTQQIDTLVVGAGLAGCSLAWRLREAGERVVVADRREIRTSSQVAAGLIAPLSGPRLLPGWRFAPAWEAAMSHYQDFESRFGVRLFHPRRKLHLFSSGEEREIFQSVRVLEHPEFIADAAPVIDSPFIHAPLGGFEMSHAGWLDVPAYLDAVTRRFDAEEALLRTSIDPAGDLCWREDRAELPRLGLSAGRVIWCEGPSGRSNPFFPGVRFNLAKGETLTLRIPALAEDRILYRGVWLFHRGGDIYRCGSTYDWSRLDCEPTPEGADEILGRLRLFLRAPFEVLDQTAAVRPVIEDVRPMFGMHPHSRRLGFFNGLASKGALLAPMLAAEFAGQLIAGKPNDDPETSLTRKAGIQPPPRLTEMAQAILDPLIGSRDIVIDATAGNGHDTMFLARKVRNRGVVHAIDRQAPAIDRLNLRLAENPCRQVRPVLGDHAEMAALIPPEHHGKVAAIMFNLGYLPGGDKTCKTTAATTRPALHQAVSLLKPNGVMTVMAYVGHPGGPEEADAVVATLGELASQIDWEERRGEPWMRHPPRLFVARKKGPAQNS